MKDSVINLTYGYSVRENKVFAAMPQECSHIVFEYSTPLKFNIAYWLQ